MPLCAGTRLGPYEILEPLGAGGMGEVYRARDPRMGREVAIKISAERFSDRFQREVRANSRLSTLLVRQPHFKWKSEGRSPRVTTSNWKAVAGMLCSFMYAALGLAQNVPSTI